MVRMRFKLVKFKFRAIKYHKTYNPKRFYCWNSKIILNMTDECVAAVTAGGKEKPSERKEGGRQGRGRRR